VRPSGGESSSAEKKNTNRVRNFFDEKWGEMRELEKRRKWGEMRELKTIRKKEENEERREIERFLQKIYILRSQICRHFCLQATDPTFKKKQK
jgi:hypothetical protein